ncbi:hypothetical protein ACTFIR_008841 [Dictyostelium discoideum]
MGRSRRGSVSSSASESASSSRSDMSSSESDNDQLKRRMKIDEPIIYCEECKLKTGSKFNLRYNTFGITNNSIVFYGSFSVKKKRKIIPLKSIKEVEWCEDDSVKLIVPREHKDKPKTYHIHFKKSHKGSPFRLIESRLNASKFDPSNRLASGEELYKNPSTANLLKHFQKLPRDERLEHSYRCRIKGQLEQNYGVMFITQTRILFLSIDTTFKSEEIKLENVLDISESLPKKGKLKKSILIDMGKNQIYCFSSFDNKEETLENLKRSLDSFKKQQVLQQQQQRVQKSTSPSSPSSTTTTATTATTPTQTTPTQTPTTPKVTYLNETPLPHGSKTATWTSVGSPQPVTSSPLTPLPTTTTTTTNNNNLQTKPTTTTTTRPPSTPLLPEKKAENYGDRANKLFPKETPTELKQNQEIKNKTTVDKSRRCCSLW